MLVTSPVVSRIRELKWNHMVRPDVISRAERAPVRGQGLGFTIWYAWVWWVIMCYRVSIDLLVG